MSHTVLDQARDAYTAGLCVLPVMNDGSKRPDVSEWKSFGSARPDARTTRAMFAGDSCGLGIVCGPTSGDVEAWDFDCHHVYEDFVETTRGIGLGELVDRIEAGYCDDTPGGGVRWLVRYPPDLDRGTRHILARRPKRPDELHNDTDSKIKVLIELPLFVVVAPSCGGVHPSGKPYTRRAGDFTTIASYTGDERDALIELARSFDRMPRREWRNDPQPSAGGGDRPGDLFNARATWDEVLEPQGWPRVYTRGETTYWRRPGKSGGVSATTNHANSDLFYVFSSSTEFEPNRGYSKFAVHTILNHGGDFSAAALALAEQGYTAGPPAEPDASLPAVTPRTLEDAHEVFLRWLGEEYDVQALDAVLAAAAAERLPGDALWLLLVSGPGNAKTETVQALSGGGAIVTSTVTSEGALLSGTPKKQAAKDATGGLLRRLGSRGLLVIKDVTSILAMNRDTRGAMLAAFREIHDGFWQRNVGTDGGKTLTWQGRIVVVGAVTTAWDRAHDVIASMGDRFVTVRMDSTVGRTHAGRGACKNTGDEVRMRQELRDVIGGVLAQVDPAHTLTLAEEEESRLVAAADIVTLARTGVDYDYRGDVIDAHAPEMPTRFAKQLLQVMRGATAIGLSRRDALRLAIRCARDSMPPLRLVILDDVAKFPGTRTRDVRRRLEKPRATVDRQLQSLHMLGLLTCEEEEAENMGRPVTLWHYRLADGIDPDVLDPGTVPDLSPTLHLHTVRERDETINRLILVTDKSGTVEDPADARVV